MPLMLGSEHLGPVTLGPYSFSALSEPLLPCPRPSPRPCPSSQSSTPTSAPA